MFGVDGLAATTTTTPLRRHVLTSLSSRDPRTPSRWQARHQAPSRRHPSRSLADSRRARKAKEIDSICKKATSTSLTVLVDLSATAAITIRPGAASSYTGSSLNAFDKLRRESAVRRRAGCRGTSATSFFSKAPTANVSYSKEQMRLFALKRLTPGRQLITICCVPSSRLFLRH